MAGVSEQQISFNKFAIVLAKNHRQYMENTVSPISGTSFAKLDISHFVQLSVFPSLKSNDSDATIYFSKSNNVYLITRKIGIYEYVGEVKINSNGSANIDLFEWCIKNNGIYFYINLLLKINDKPFYNQSMTQYDKIINVCGWICIGIEDDLKYINFNNNSNETSETTNNTSNTSNETNLYNLGVDNYEKITNSESSGSINNVEAAIDPFEQNELSKWVAANYESVQYSSEAQYFNELYGGGNVVWSTRSFRSIIGMPFHFMEQVDPRVGSSPLGKQFIEDIVYDMPLVCLRPGGPVMNSSLSGGNTGGVLSVVKKFLSYHSAFFNNNASTLSQLSVPDEDTGIDDSGTGLSDGLKTILVNLFVGKYARFYTFGSDMYKYIEYVNTLCHLFISFLDIGDLTYTPGQYYGENADRTPRKYAYYNDTWETCESDGGDSMRFMQGPNQAIFGYYQPESQLNQTYSNSTRQSELASSLSQGSSIAKEWHFLMGSSGINLLDGEGPFENLANKLAGINGNGLVGRLIGNAAEGISTVFSGNNLDLPEIWEDSQGGTEHTLVFKLCSPYGDRESIFLYVLRPLARLMAMAFPRQFGPNSYTSPFLIQAFSKGQFNVQCGIVSSISIRRCGNGGESHTVHYIPTELEVSMTIQDMYDLVTLSNEYMGSSDPNGFLGAIKNTVNAVNPFGSARAARLLFNNIGLIDFCAAYCGFNLNSPEIDVMWTLLIDIWRNRISDVMENPLTTGTSQWKSPKWSRSMTDAFYGAVQRFTGFISG